MERLDRDMASCVADMKSLDSLIKMRVAETAQAIKNMDALKHTLKSETNRIEDIINNLDFKISNKLTIFEQTLSFSQEKIVDFDILLKEVQKFAKDTYDTSTRNSLTISTLTE